MTRRWILLVPVLVWLLMWSTFAGTLAQFRSALGTIDVELFDDVKPITVQNFLRYVRSGAYPTNMFFHRWDAGFVVQGGGFVVATRGNTNYFDPVPSFGDITNEFAVGPKLSNTYGTLAMARIPGQTNSASSQWFFNLGDNSFLDSSEGGFTVFGRVVGGTNVLNRFNNLSFTNGIFLLPLPEPFNQLPVLSINPTFRDLIYLNVSVLNVQLNRLASGEREVSWTSVSNRLNHLEAASSIPPSWRALLTTNGTGGTLRFRDANKTNVFRLYRVRVDY